MTIVRRALPFALATALGGCAVGEDYRRPELAPPPAYRGASVPGPSLGAQPWSAVYPDASLRSLIDAVLAANLDLQVAEARVRESQATVVLARSQGLPSLALALNTSPTARIPGDQVTSTFLAGAVLNWEIDLWGRVRRGTEAAQADLAGREAAREGARASLVAETASRYYELAAFREVLDRTEEGAKLQADSLRLIRRRNAAGIVSSAEVRQAEGQLASTEARIPDLRRQIVATENAIALLLGRAPEAFNAPVATPAAPIAIPAGLPSELLERRPDLREAEQRLVAANAKVGEAKAQLLPTISLTGTLGNLSTKLGDALRNDGSVVASIGPNASQALYAGGALVANREAAIARLDQALLGYRKAVLVALREVSDALTAHEAATTALEKQQTRVVASREALRLANRRFDAGITSYLEVLDAQRQLLAAETDLATTRLARQSAYVGVYRALGGGWNASGGKPS